MYIEFGSFSIDSNAWVIGEHFSLNKDSNDEWKIGHYSLDLEPSANLGVFRLVKETKKHYTFKLLFPNAIEGQPSPRGTKGMLFETKLSKTESALWCENDGGRQYRFSTTLKIAKDKLKRRPKAFKHADQVAGVLVKKGVSIPPFPKSKSKRLVTLPPTLENRSYP